MNFTIVTSKDPISKQFSVDSNGKLFKNDGGNLKFATFKTVNYNINDINEIISDSNFDDKNIFIAGTTGHDYGSIMTKSEIKRRENEDPSVPRVTRTLNDFGYRGGDGFIYLDYDPSSDYKLNNGEPYTKDELLNLYYEILPEIKDAPHLWKTSSSSCIYDKDGNELSGIKGQHLFIHIKDNMDIKRVVDIFYKRLWLHGHGFIFVDKTGGMHDRTVIDRVVNSPERLIFLKANCIGDIYQKMQIEVFNKDNDPLDTSSIGNFDANEDGRFEQLVNNARDKCAERSNSIRKIYVKKNAEVLGLTRSKLDNCIVSKVLYSDNIIKLANGVSITVAELYSNHDLYHGEYCHDPLEPNYGGSTGSSTKAWIDLDNSRIYSHAHGGVTYVMEHGARKSPLELALEVCDMKDHLVMFRIAANEAINMRYLATELDQLITFIAKNASMKKGSCEKAFNGEYRRIKGTDDKVGNIDINKSEFVDKDGVFDKDYLQTNISAPVTLQFPHTYMRGDIRMNYDTVENFEFMTKAYGISFLYDVIFKSPDIIFPIGIISEGDNKSNASMSRLKSLCVLNGLGKDSVNYVTELVNANQINPVLQWINEEKWDGNPRLELICENIHIKTYGNSEDDDVNKEFSEKYKRKVLRMWFLQCIAALDGSKRSPLAHKTGVAVPKYEYILVFVGSQGVNKTKFIKSLLPNELNQYILTGHELDTKDKDNIKIAISHWITELGELDSTFKKSDISSLKAFMSKEDDEIRMPYAATESKFVRRTSFCGSVNDIQFLVDKTGNRRYLPIEVLSLNPLYEIDIPITDGEKLKGIVSSKMSAEYQNRQLWAEILHYYLEGEQWWPDTELEHMLDTVVQGHERVDPVVEAIEEKFNLYWNDAKCKDKGVRIKGGHGISNVGDSLKFACLNAREVCFEVDLSTTDARVVGLVSNYLSTKGLIYKVRNVDSKSKKAFRICLHHGENLKKDFGIGIKT